MTRPETFAGVRASGVLLHPTSLPGPGVGDLGQPTLRWLDWLADAGQGLWQILPLVPVDGGGSPYSGLSALAGNPLLLSPELLARDGLLEAGEAEDGEFSAECVDFPGVLRWKDALLRRAHEAFRAGRGDRALEAEFAEHRRRNAGWVEDYALFRALRDRFGGKAWAEWAPPLRDREPGALEQAREDLAGEVERHAFGQFLFDRQWGAVRREAAARGIRIIGDVPIFVSHDSADVWAHRDLFELDGQGRPTVVSGVPPDYFSETGQRWGNPLYRWDVMRERGYAWWTERFRRTLEQVDFARVDHFRGFEAYWEVPAEEETALNGTWQPGPGTRLFRALEEEMGPLPLIAEDLGLITPEVEALRDELGFPGMRVLHFAFGDDEKNPHLPANHVANSVAYTGTHDNDTSRGWWEAAGKAERAGLRKLTPAPEGEIHWGMIETVFRSDAAVAIVPVQDVLGLGSEARMNTPGTAEGNWAWRLREGVLTPELAARLRELTVASGRASVAGS